MKKLFLLALTSLALAACGGEDESKQPKVVINPGDVGVKECSDTKHPHAIDLGLPSGTKWACCNVGATKPEDKGGYFSWCDPTERKNSFSWMNYCHYNVNNRGEVTFTQLPDETQGTAYDVVKAKWGYNWVTPSQAQFKELLDKCELESIVMNGVAGIKVTGPNKAFIFLPAAGFKETVDKITYTRNEGEKCNYWTSAKASQTEELEDRAIYVSISKFLKKEVTTCNQCNGLSLRPVNP